MPVSGGVQRASIQTRTVPMFDDVAARTVAGHLAKMMVQPFTVEQALALIEEKCGRYVRGKHEGQLRGWASISLCTEGGWKRHGPGERNGRVVYPGQIVGISIGDDFSGKTYLQME